MSTISSILESVVLDDNDNNISLSKNPMKSFSLTKVIRHGKAPISTITFWQWKIVEYVYMTYRRGIACSSDIDITKVLVDPEMRLIETSIISKSYEISEMSEAQLIQVMLNLHMSMYRLITLKHYGADKYMECAMLRTFGNYFYSSIVSDTTRKLNALELVRYSEMLHKVTVLGMFNEISDIMTHKDKKE